MRCAVFVARQRGQQERRHFLARMDHRSGIPYAHRAVVRARGDDGAVGGEGHRVTPCRVCPFMTLSALPDLASHVRTVLSLEPDAITAPSGEKATEITHWCAPP